MQSSLLKRVVLVKQENISKKLIIRTFSDSPGSSQRIY